MGTEHPEYEERFRAVAKPIRVSRKFSEQVSVITLAVFAGSVTVAGWIPAVSSGGV